MKKVFISSFVGICWLGALTVQADTKEEIAKTVKRYSNNIGFAKGEKRDKLKKRFPMCEAFLNVNWYDKQPGQKYQRGWSVYNVWKNGKKLTEYAVLIVEPDTRNIRLLSVYWAKRKWGKNWKTFIRDFRVKNVSFGGVIVTYNGETLTMFKNYYSYAIVDDYMNLCIVYPEKDFAYFQAFGIADRRMSKQETTLFLKKIHKYLPNYNEASLQAGTIVDVNHDGKNDIVYTNSASCLYSVGKQYYTSKWFNLIENNNDIFMYVYPPTNKSCSFDFDKSPQFNCTDGKDIYIGNFCNLSELTSQKGE